MLINAIDPEESRIAVVEDGVLQELHVELASREAYLGNIYKGKVVKIVDFGAFVNFFGKRDGLVHVSQIENRRLNHPSDVLKEGQEV